jgi:NAD(P)-dependent dehydrogenase (short-subunit alcohol dehydrogenase family)
MTTSKNFLITGANSGFGLLMAQRFAGAGHKIHAGYRNPARVGALKALKEAGLSIEPIQLDVRDPKSIGEAVAFASQTAAIDVLINNAGYAVRCSVEDLTDQELADQLDTNVIGVLRMTRAVLPQMRARRSGAVVNISSIAGLVGVPYEGAYAASKHAVEALSEALWYEVAPFGVRVHVIEPGAFATGFVNNIVTGSQFDERSPHWPLAERFRAGAGGYVGSLPPRNPEDVADAVLAAISSDPPRLRHAVGADAAQLIPAHRGRSFEEFAGGVLTMLKLDDWTDGPAA